MPDARQDTPHAAAYTAYTTEATSETAGPNGHSQNGQNGRDLPPLDLADALTPLLSRLLACADARCIEAAAGEVGALSETAYDFLRAELQRRLPKPAPYRLSTLDKVRRAHQLPTPAPRTRSRSRHGLADGHTSQNGHAGQNGHNGRVHTRALPKTPAGTDAQAIDDVAVRIERTPWYLSLDGTQLYEYHCPPGVDRDDEEARSVAAYYVPVFTWGAPRTRYTVRFGEADAAEGRRLCYAVDIGGREQLITYEELHNGKCWERWTGLGVSGRQTFERLAIVVDSQASPAYQTEGRLVPEHEGRRSTGWQRLSDGRWVLILPDGRMLGATGICADVRAYLSVEDRHVRPYVGVELDPTTPTSHAAQVDALAYVARLGQRSIPALVLAMHLRSILYGIWRSDVTGIVRGLTQLGKSSLSSSLRNLTGDFTGWPLPEATMAFNDTTAAMEHGIAQIGSLPVIVDDLVIQRNDSEHDKHMLTDKIEKLVRSIANNQPMKRRMRQDMTAQRDYKVSAWPVLSAEELPCLRESLLARTLLLDIGQGDLDLKQLRRSDAQAPGMRSLGWGFIQYVAAQLDQYDADEIVEAWRTEHTGYTARLKTDIEKSLGGSLPTNATRLDSNGAHLLLALHILQEYAEGAGVENPLGPEAVYADLVAHLVHQVHEIARLETGGSDGEPFREWAPRTIRESLAKHAAYLTNRDDEQPLTPDCPVPASNLGWEGEYHRGMRLGELDAGGVNALLDPHNLYTLLCDAAKRDRRPMPNSPRAVWARMAEEGLIEPSRGSEQAHSARLVKIGGKPVRRIIVASHHIWPNDPDSPGDGSDGDGGNTGEPAGPSAPDTSDTAPVQPVQPTTAYTPDPTDPPIVRELLGELPERVRAWPIAHTAAVAYAAAGCPSLDIVIGKDGVHARSGVNLFFTVGRLSDEYARQYLTLLADLGPTPIAPGPSPGEWETF